MWRLAYNNIILPHHSLCPLCISAGMWYSLQVLSTAMVALCSRESVTPYSMLSTTVEAGTMFEDNWTLWETMYAMLLQSWLNQAWSMLPYTDAYLMEFFFS